MSLEQELADFCDVADRLYDRGYTHGSTGNLSVRIGDRIFVTPTGRPLKGLTPASLAEIDVDGKSRTEIKPSKEVPFHLAVYRQRPDARAVVHLHSFYSVALSCLADLDVARPLPAITPYYFMRVAPLGVVPYFKPGSGDLAEAIEQAAGAHHCLLLRNHGSVCAGTSLSEASDRAEELEATARLYFQLTGRALQELTPAQIAALRS